MYVRYPAEELYAVFSLESHRHQTLLVGEDLGTVPAEVPAAMRVHGIQRMFVAQYALHPDPDNPLTEIEADSVASLNTHDMPPFAAFVRGEDIRERASLRLLGNLNPDTELENRQAAVEAFSKYVGMTRAPETDEEIQTLLQACLRFISRSSSGIVLVNLEDLWIESRPQNIPGSGNRYSNWARKAKAVLEDVTHTAEVQAAVAQLAGRAKAVWLSRPIA